MVHFPDFLAEGQDKLNRVARQLPAVSVDSDNLVCRVGPVLLSHIEFGVYGVQRVALPHSRGRPVKQGILQDAGCDGSTG